MSRGHFAVTQTALNNATAHAVKAKTQSCLRNDWTAFVWGWDRITVSKLGLSFNGLTDLSSFQKSFLGFNPS